MFVAKNVGDFGNLCLVMHIIYVYMHFGLQRTKYLLFFSKVVHRNFVRNMPKCRNKREDAAADIPQFTRPKRYVVSHFYT